MSGSPSRQCPAWISRVTTSRIWAAVISVASSAGPSRTASSGSVHDVRPGSSATTSEYGQPGIICAFPFPRAYVWQNSRSGHPGWPVTAISSVSMRQCWLSQAPEEYLRCHTLTNYQGDAGRVAWRTGVPG